MECTRFVKLLKAWYIQVQDEALAPARMASFMEKHLVECQVCRLDPEARRDVDRIKTMVLPQDKIKIPALEAEEEGEEAEEGLDGALGDDEDDLLGEGGGRRSKTSRHDDDEEGEESEEGEEGEEGEEDEEDELAVVDELEVDLL